MRHKRTDVVRMPKVVLPARPKGSELREIYRGLLTNDQGQRLAKLATALHWYQLAQPYLSVKYGALNEEQLKHERYALRFQVQARGTPYDDEKEVAYKLALKRYEKIYAAMKPPKIEPYLTELHEHADRLKEKEARLKAKFGSVTDVIKSALNPVNIEGQSFDINVGDIKDTMQVNPERNALSLRKDVVSRLRIKRRVDGVLPMLFEILIPVARLCALVPEKDPNNVPTGRYAVDGKAYIKKIHELQQNIVAYAKTDDAPKRLVRNSAPVDPNKPKVNRPFPVYERKPKVAGVFREGSMPAIMFEILREQRQPIEFKELAAQVKAKSNSTQMVKLLVPQMPRYLGNIDLKGTASGRWHIEILDGNKARLIENQSA